MMLTTAFGVKAQQAPIFTNYSNSYAYANPGFAGMSEGINLLGLYRQQWAGFVDNDGNEVAPQTFLLTGDMPFRKLHGGLEFSVMSDKLGFEKIFVSKYNAKGLDTRRFKIQIVPVASIYEMGAELFG